MRAQIYWIQDELFDLFEVFHRQYLLYKNIPLPGYSHMQSAMPSSVGMWIHAWMEDCLELVEEGSRVFQRMNNCPLGSAAGFGSGLPLDRDYTAELLGFSGIQRSFLSCQNNRGVYEERFVFWLSEIAFLWEKFASDVVLYTSSEFEFFKLPPELTTGSSIMPQKRNPDMAELLRAHSAKIQSSLQEIKYLKAKLTTGYHRDFQLTKEPVIRAVQVMKNIFLAAKMIAQSFQPQKDKILKSMRPELYATYEAYSKISEGVSFRDAYREVAEAVKNRRIDTNNLETFYRQVLMDTDRGIESALKCRDTLMEKTKETEELNRTLVKVLSLGSA